MACILCLDSDNGSQVQGSLDVFESFRVCWCLYFEESSDFGSFHIALCGSTLKGKGKVKVPKDGVFPLP